MLQVSLNLCAVCGVGLTCVDGNRPKQIRCSVNRECDCIYTEVLVTKFVRKKKRKRRKRKIERAESEREGERARETPIVKNLFDGSMCALHDECMPIASNE